MMYAYLSRFESNTFPIPEWGVAVVWLILCLISHLVALRGRQAFRAQECVHVGPPAGLVRPVSARLILAQLFLAAAIFTVAHFAARLIGQAFFVFFAGGYVLTTAALAMNLCSWLLYRDLKPPRSVGTITVSKRLVVRSQSYWLWSAGAFCLCVGLLIAHLAFLGAAYFLGCTGLGFLRKSNAERPAEGELVTQDSSPRDIGTSAD